MPRRVSRAQAVTEAARVARAHRDSTVWIGVDGFGAAGKSTLAASIAAAVPEADVVHIDDFAAPSVPEWDWPRFRRQVVAPLLAGERAHYQIWDWERDVGGRWAELAPGRPLVVEGVSCTRSEVGAPWDLTIWVDAPRELRLRRALDRDGERLLPRWLDDWMPSEEAYAERERPQDRVDLLVSGTE